MHTSADVLLAYNDASAGPQRCTDCLQLRLWLPGEWLHALTGKALEDVLDVHIIEHATLHILSREQERARKQQEYCCIS